MTEMALTRRARAVRWAWRGMLAGGGSLLLLALTVDLIRTGGLGGFGMYQAVAAVAGLAVMGAGLAIVPRGAAWRTAAGDVLFDRDTFVAELPRLTVIVLEVAGLALLMWAFRIENPAFYGRLGPLIAVGFVLHHLTPLPYRLAGFLALSLAGIVLVFGVSAGAWLVGVGVVLVAACHLPAPIGIRVAVVAALGGILAAMRAGVGTPPWPAAIWPILGSMFMFRLIAYLYDLSHQKEPVRWTRTFSYFFLLPNVVFPLFPVVDFNTFRRTYYDRPALEIYQQGAHWMLRGLIHLLAYRLVYHYAAISPVEVTNTADLVRYMVANFGLYLRVSGQFHLIVGILHLFGFRLPETHRFFYLASSFTDFWRRINIYWKDFMQKLVFNPAYFPLRKRLGDTGALVGASLLVFAATWVFHSYQWFWLLGTWLWSPTDAMFWGILAGLLVISSLREVQSGRTRSLGGQALGAAGAWRLALGSAATFTAICVLWSLWTSPTLKDWLALLRTATLRPVDVLVLIAVPSVIGVSAVITSRIPVRKRVGPASVIATAALLLSWLAVGQQEAVARHLPLAARRVLRDVRSTELNRPDAARLQRGYYENIVGVNRFNGQLWEVYARGRSRDETNLQSLGALRQVNDLRLFSLKAMLGIDYLGKPFRTNAWGMRDRDYERARPQGVHRIAVLGASPTMGHGVGDGEPFEALAEERLNRAAAPGRPRYEWLNFGVAMYFPLSQLALLENGPVFAFEPDAVLYVALKEDFDVYVTIWNSIRGRRVSIPWAPVRDIATRSGITPEMPWEEAMRRLRPYDAELLAWTYQRIVERCRERNVTPVWTFLPMEPHDTPPDKLALMRRLAQEAGFEIIDLENVFAGHDPDSLVLAEWDLHHNAYAHQLIANRLFEEFSARPVLLGLSDGAPTPPPAPK